MAAVAAGLRRGQFAIDVHELRTGQMRFLVLAFAPGVLLHEIVADVADDEVGSATQGVAQVGGGNQRGEQWRILGGAHTDGRDARLQMRDMRFHFAPVELMEMLHAVFHG